MKYCYILLVTLVSVFAEDAENVLLRSNSLFSAKLYQEMLKSSEENFLVSPFSAEVIFALVETGAKNETAAELRKSLQLPEESKIKEEFKKLLSDFIVHNENYIVATANKVYIRDNFPIKEEFKTIATNYFSSYLENINFKNGTAAAQTINKWIEEQTDNKIRDLITSDALSEATAAVLINALYFKARWLTPFFLPSTRKNKFHLKAGKFVEVDTMYEVLTEYKYFENAELNAKFLEMPFENEEATMTFVLPNEIDGLEKLESQINKVFEPQNFEKVYVNVSVPKFKIESTVDFKQVLQNLGVKKAFIEGEADFSGISDNKLVISDALQKTFIDVNEQGVEAAASTYIRLVEYFGLDAPTKDFHANHPFIYYIKVKGFVLFAGRVIMPTY
ncbi:antichymotrypsin-2-like [Zophobas morio]|uniref:antichymotrypsin-2-like n=1 Tax=Zophobas morio TaxID=2755281 RepID=UPI003082C799